MKFWQNFNVFYDLANASKEEGLNLLYLWINGGLPKSSLMTLEHCHHHLHLLLGKFLHNLIPLHD